MDCRCCSRWIRHLVSPGMGATRNEATLITAAVEDLGHPMQSGLSISQRTSWLCAGLICWEKNLLGISYLRRGDRKVTDA